MDQKSRSALKLFVCRHSSGIWVSDAKHWVIKRLYRYNGKKMETIGIIGIISGGSFSSHGAFAKDARNMALLWSGIIFSSQGRGLIRGSKFFSACIVHPKPLPHKRSG